MDLHLCVLCWGLGDILDIYIYRERERERIIYIIYILVAFRCLQACRPQLLSARLSAVQVVSSARSSQYQPGQRTNSIQATSHLVIDLPLRIALVSKICNDILSLLKGPHFLSADPTLEMLWKWWMPWTLFE